MRLKRITSAAYAILAARVFNKKMPLVVSWKLTYRCNYKCTYCGSWKVSSDELPTEKILLIIDELHQMGTQKIVFTGGEPLLREDLGVILGQCRKKKISVSVNSNGSLVRKKINELKNIATLNLSLDGPEEIHDSIRGKGSYAELMKAVDIALENNLNVGFAVTLSQLNFNYLDFMLKKARELNVSIFFQPATENLLRCPGINPIFPDEGRYKRVIDKLIIEKRDNRFIRNSVSGLKYLYHWPHPHSHKMRCAGGNLFCNIEPNGDVKICGRVDEEASGNAVEAGFKEVFNNLKPIFCNRCWCAMRLELNYLFHFKPEVIFNTLMLFFHRFW